MSGDKKEGSFLQRMGVLKKPEDNEVVEQNETNSGDTPLYFDKNQKEGNFKDLTFDKVEVAPEFNIVPDKNVFNPFIESTKQVYQQEFTKMNAPEIDFFEFYNSIQNSENKSTEAFKMAFSMIRSMNPSLTKEVLVKQADDYLKRVSDSYTTVKSNGQSSKQKNISELNSQKETLSKEIEQMKNALQMKQQEFDNLENKSKQKIQEITLKLQANDEAYNELSESINFVKTNLNQI